jgi:hypothetical protein
MTTAYPLAWPDGWPRTNEESRRDGRYNFRRPASAKAPFWNFIDARNELLAELKRLGARNVVLSSNFRPDRNGIPVEGDRRPRDQGIAVYFELEGAPRTMARDSYTRAEENMRALTLAIEAMRTLERHGGSLMMRRAFQGFVALPAPRSPFEILGVEPDASLDEIERAHKRQARTAHPDAGGSTARMAELNAARDQALKMRGMS